MVKHIANAGDFEELSALDTTVLVDFWAQWCGPCKQISPMVDILAEEFTERLVVVKVDIDQHPELAARYNVMSIPTLLFLDGGHEKGRLVGARSMNELRKLVEAQL